MKKHKKNVPLGGKQLNDTVFALLDSFPEPVFLIDPAGKILDANTAFTSIISPHYPKFLGANVYSIHAEGESFPEIASGLKEKAEEVLRTGKRLAFEETQDGKTCRHTITPSSSPDGRISHLFIIVQEIVSHDFSSPKRIAGEDQQELAIYKDHS